MANQDHQVKGPEAHLHAIQNPTVGAEVAVLRHEVMIGSRLVELVMTRTVPYYLYETLIPLYPIEYISQFI